MIPKIISQRADTKRQFNCYGLDTFITAEKRIVSQDPISFYLVVSNTQTLKFSIRRFIGTWVNYDIISTFTAPKKGYIEIFINGINELTISTNFTGLESYISYNYISHLYAAIIGEGNFRPGSAGKINEINNDSFTLSSQPDIDESFIKFTNARLLDKQV